MTPNNNALKSPYFRNSREADDFEDKVHLFKEKPFAIAIGFDGDPNDIDSAFEIACRKFESEPEMISALVYVISKIAEQRGFNATITFKPANKEVEQRLIALANEVANHIPIQKEAPAKPKLRIFSIFRRPPENPQAV